MRVLFDSDALIGLFVTGDAHHQTAKKILEKLIQKKTVFFVSNLVIQETATVLSYKIGQSASNLFLQSLPSLGAKRIVLDQLQEQKAWDLFQSIDKRGTSFTDCSNVVLFQEQRMGAIFSFDHFYKTLRIPVCT